MKSKILRELKNKDNKVGKGITGVDIQIKQVEIDD